MASQPLNTTISVYRRLRTFKDNRRHTSVKHLTTPFDGDLVAVPGEEIQVLQTRDSNITDAFRSGHPVVVYPRAACTLATLYAGVSGLDFPVRMVGNPREIQVQKSSANVADDLYGQAAALCPGRAFVA
jgi:hypothetical protein